MFKKFTRYELIGSYVSVSDAKNKSLVGISGMIVDETRNMLAVEDEMGNVKKVTKKDVIFDFTFASKKDEIKARIRGDLLINKPEDRIKRIRK